MRELEEENRAKQEKLEEAHEIMARQKTIMANIVNTAKATVENIKKQKNELDRSIERQERKALQDRIKL